MTVPQIELFVLLFLVMVFLVWGRWRYDVVAFLALLLALTIGVVPTDQAFTGFGHPATVIIAMVLVVSRGLSNSGAIDLLARFVASGTRKLGAHVAIMATLAAGLSALMNNVAALALLMPVDIQAARQAKRSPSLSLMAVSFASILGGMITLIGTPPNIVISEFRAEELGAAFRMFDFAPVGLACAAAGVAYVTLIGWRLLPRGRQEAGSDKSLFDLAEYVAELKVAEGSKISGKRVADLDEMAEKADVEILGLVRGGQRMPGLGRRVVIEDGDILVVEADPGSIEAVQGTFGLEYVGAGTEALKDELLELREIVVPAHSSLVGRSAASMRLLYRFGIALVGISRQGKRIRQNVRSLRIEAGDVLLLLGAEDRHREVVGRIKLLPLLSRGHQVIQRDKAGIAVALFVAAIVAASVGGLYLAVALGMVAVAYVLLDIVPLRTLYDSVEWPVIVLLGCMIPIGGALESTGASSLLVDGLLRVSEGLSPAVVLVLLMAITMTLSDVMNNTATAVIAAPIAVETATRLGVNVDPFLMAVAVAASCAFLTPIGHKNNTLILGPGGYRFGDYWRMGLPLEILIIVVSVPMILWVWPLR